MLEDAPRNLQVPISPGPDNEVPEGLIVYHFAWLFWSRPLAHDNTTLTKHTNEYVDSFIIHKSITCTFIDIVTLSIYYI